MIRGVYRLPTADFRFLIFGYPHLGAFKRCTMTDKETELIQALIQALDRLTTELKSRSAPVSSSPAGQAQPAPASSSPADAAQFPAAPAPVKAPEHDRKPEDAVPAEAQSNPGMTFDELKDMCIQAAKAGKQKLVIDFLAHCGKQKLSELKPETYPALAGWLKSQGGI